MRKKRYLCLLLSILFLFTFFTPAYADNALIAESTLTEQCTDYAVDSMKRYIGLHGLGANLKMSQPIPVHNNQDDDVWAFFLFDSSYCIGLMMISYVGENFYSSFHSSSNYSLLNTITIQNTPFALVSQNESLLLATNNDVFVLNGHSDISSKNSLILSFDNLDQHKINLEPIALSENEPLNTNMVRSNSFALDVPYVANQDAPDDEERGLCWAASSAAIFSCRTDGSISLSALSLYTQMRNMYNPSIYGYPEGTPTWVKRCFRAYNLQFTHLSSGITYEAAKNIIENQERPIYAHLTRDGGNHAVVISGFTSGYGYYYYVLMDPNVDGTVTVPVSNDSSTTFTYPASYGYTYTGWAHTIY